MGKQKASVLSDWGERSRRGLIVARAAAGSSLGPDDTARARRAVGLRGGGMAGPPAVEPIWEEGDGRGRLGV